MMEICFLEMIDYNVIVHQGLFAKYYFELRSISEEQNFSNMHRKLEPGVEGWESARKKSSTQAAKLHVGSEALMAQASLPSQKEKDKKKSAKGTESRRSSMPPPSSDSRQI